MKGSLLVFDHEPTAQVIARYDFWANAGLTPSRNNLKWLEPR